MPRQVCTFLLVDAARSRTLPVTIALQSPYGNRAGAGGQPSHRSAITAGTSSSLLQGPSFEGFWQTRLDHHVLWGPFATLFTPTLRWRPQPRCPRATRVPARLTAGPQRPLPLLLTAGLLIGITANIQTIRSRPSFPRDLGTVLVPCENDLEGSLFPRPLLSPPPSADPSAA